MIVNLRKHYFTEKEHLFFQENDIKVYLFRYESGVEAIRIENSRGYIVVLPYNGQMIWEAFFNGRYLNMFRIQKSEAKNVNYFLDSYDSFFSTAVRSGWDVQPRQIITLCMANSPMPHTTRHGYTQARIKEGLISQFPGLICITVVLVLAIRPCLM